MGERDRAAREAVVGLTVQRLRTLSFALAGFLGGLAGVLITPITTLRYDVGVLLGCLLEDGAEALAGPAPLRPEVDEDDPFAVDRVRSDEGRLFMPVWPEH